MGGSIAVVGASRNRSKFGNKCVRAYALAGWTVYPVNPREEEIEGLEVFSRLADLPGPVDRVSVYLAPPLTLGLMPQLAAAGAEVFFNPGSANGEVLGAAEAAGVRYREACSIVDIGLSPAQFP